MKKRLFLIVALFLGLLLLSGCATKKFVRQSISDSEAKMNKKIDDNNQKIYSQLSELSQLNKQLSSKLEEVSDKANLANQKAEEAKNIGMAAKEKAETADKNAKLALEKFNNRFNFVVVDTAYVYFGFNKYHLTKDAVATLDDVAKKFAENKNYIMVLEGHTDSIGPKEYNYILSEKRVKSVLRYLVGVKKLDINRIYTVGLGKLNPIADNKTRQGRKKNRRVTIKIMEVK